MSFGGFNLNHDEIYKDIIEKTDQLLKEVEILKLNKNNSSARMNFSFLKNSIMYAYETYKVCFPKNKEIDTKIEMIKSLDIFGE